MDDGRDQARTGFGLSPTVVAASDSFMADGESPQPGAEQTRAGQAGVMVTVPFEVVRRAEFVFDPFLGSLIQLPEAGTSQAPNTQYFLPVQMEAVQAEALQAEVVQAVPLPAEEMRAEVLPVEVEQAEEVEPVVLQADVEHAETRPAEVWQAEVEQAEVGPVEVWQEEELPAEVEEYAAPVGMKEESPASAKSKTIEENLPAEPAAEKVAFTSRLTPLVQEQWQIAEAKPRETTKHPSLPVRIGRWLWKEVPTLVGSRRRAERRVLPGLHAFYWSGGTPKPHEVVNISKTGFYMRTTELWSVETLVRMTLQRPRKDANQKLQSVGVLARVVRIDEGGVGHEFVTTEALLAARSLDVMPNQGTNSKELDKFLEAG
jgi:hypothetical protein